MWEGMKKGATTALKRSRKINLIDWLRAQYFALFRVDRTGKKGSQNKKYLAATNDSFWIKLSFIVYFIQVYNGLFLPIFKNIVN